jgi:hypothetical protein
VLAAEEKLLGVGFRHWMHLRLVEWALQDWGRGWALGTTVMLGLCCGGW